MLFFAFIRKDCTNILKTKQFLQPYSGDFLVLSFLNFKMSAVVDVLYAKQPAVLYKHINTTGCFSDNVYNIRYAYLRKSSLIGEKQSISIPSSRHTHPCIRSGRI